MVPLAMVEQGKEYTVLRVMGKDDVRQHLAELGITVDSRVKIVSKLAGNYILQVKESRLAIDESLTKRIMVE